MSLRSRLFGAIGLTLCAVLAVAMWVAVLQANRTRQQANRTRQLADLARQRMHDTLDLASAMLASGSPDYVHQWGLVDQNGALDARLDVVAIFETDAMWQPVLRESFGVRKFDPELARRAGALVNEALRPVAEAEAANAYHPGGNVARRGNAIARVYRSAAGRHASGTGVAIYYLEAPDPQLRDMILDPFEFGQTMFVVIVLAAALLLVFTWFIVDRVVARPLDQVVGAAVRIAEGDYSVPVPVGRGDDEIQQVITAFNSMMVELDQMQGHLKERIGEAVRDSRKTQDSLVIAQRLAATGRLAAGIAHEVNNPLAGMLNAVRSLRSGGMKPERRDEYLGLVEEGLQRIERTVAKILQFTPHKVAPRDLELADVVRPVIALARHRIEREEVETTVELPEDVQVFGDLYELQQALLNVVLNALDSMSDVPDRASRMFVRVSVEGDAVHILVRDNGAGIQPEDEDRAFDLFFTTKETGKGSGMGLATVHKILSDHGGSVDLRSRGSEGVDLDLILPRFVRG